MPVNIKGKEYVTVAERVAALHEQLPEQFDIESEVLSHEPQVVVKTTITIHYKSGDRKFTGISAANPEKPIEKISPYEVAETSSCGRAAGFAGFGAVDGIATADEMKKAEASQDNLDFFPGTSRDEKPATLRQKEAVIKIADSSGHPISFSEVSSWTFEQASRYISKHGHGSYTQVGGSD